MRPKRTQGEAAFEIKECRNGNVGAVQAILAASPGAAQWSDQAIANALEANPACHFVSLIHGQVTGFISGRRAGGEGEILNLAVKPEFRRRGLGQALVNVVLEGFHRDGVTQVFLEVRESNHAAISFYELLGFREVGRRGNYYHDPEEAALVLGRSLDPTSSWGA
jgi:ribosomal-protein-alanine N-acetyltransferase